MDFSNLAKLAEGALNRGKEGDQQQHSGGIDFGAIASGLMSGGGGGGGGGGIEKAAIQKMMSMAGSMSGGEPSHSEIQQAHDMVYKQGGGLQDMTNKMMGMAAAYEIMNKFGGGGGGKGIESIISMAIKEGMALLGKSGGAGSGGQKDMMMSVVQTVMKMKG
ncbi:hypothetical protein AX774_g5969 [Zancudomyces culisetae]|uniref:Uncharacterized protein n=1 Tax=Zancudomyces culisetae TaxID=1213189 RepID=A0A1R1PI10_ZANCU|nr:hypothetical protein AX774_g5969 [Zancudomyces culisetae]|eukprot:OMH80587.1 hypothetical protein AX774_g5969 [Zancudomyces culisetae]